MKWYRQVLSDPNIKSFSGSSRTRYEFGAKYVKGKKVLDIGFGEGGGADLMLEKGAKKVIGIDYDKEKVREARNRYQQSGIEFRWLNASNLHKIKEKFEVITCFELIEHLTETEQLEFVKMLKNQLVKDGIVILSTPNRLVRPAKGRRPDNPFHEKELSPGELRGLFKGYFSKVKLYGFSCVDQQYINKQQELAKRWQNQVVEIIWKYRWVYKLGRLVPEKIRRAFDKTDLVKEPGVEGFKIRAQKINSSEILILVANT